VSGFLDGPQEQPGCRQMIKLDLLYLLFAYLLRMTNILLFNLVFPNLSYVYNYWFNCTDNARMRNDVSTWVLYLTLMVLSECIYRVYVSLQYGFLFLQWIFSALLWWPKFYWELMRDPGGRSLYEIFTDPRFRGSVLRTKPRISRETRRQYLEKGKMRIQPTNSRHNVFSSYQVQGAFAHLGQNENQKVMYALVHATNYIHFDDPLRLSVPYEFVTNRIPEPPDNDFMKLIACSTVVGIYAVIFTLSYYLILKKSMASLMEVCDIPLGCIDDLNDCSSPNENSSTDSVRKVHVFATSEDQEETVSFDSDGTPFVIDNSANCIICNDKTLFVGPLKRQKTEVNTSNGVNNPQYVGTMRVQFTDDKGESMEYDIPNVVYDPNSPFNIMGVPELGRYFGSKDEIPNDDPLGTWIKSSATQSTLTWDHGKHTRTFEHSSRRLP